MTSWQARMALFLAALAARLAALGVAVAQGNFPELWEYEYLARNVLAGKGFVYFHLNTEYRAYVEPFYPFLVASVYAVTNHSFLALGLVQCVISSLVALAVYDIGRRTFGHTAGVAAGLIVALHPGLAGYAVKFHPLVLDSLFIALVVLTILRLVQQPGGPSAVVFGITLGACVLTRPTILAFALPAVAWIVWRRTPDRSASLAILGLVIATAVVSPWVIRNYAALGTFVLTRTNTPFVFWLGNHPGAPGGASDGSGALSLFSTAPAELQQRIFSADEATQNRIFLEEALRYVRQDPVAFVRRTLRKLYYFWWFAPYVGKRYPSWQISAYSGFYVVTLALAGLGLGFACRRLTPAQRAGITLGLLLLSTISISQALFYVDGRHRLAVEPLLIVFSGQGLARLLARLWGAPATAARTDRDAGSLTV